MAPAEAMRIATGANKGGGPLIIVVGEGATPHQMPEGGVPRSKASTTDSTLAETRSRCFQTNSRTDSQSIQDAMIDCVVNTRSGDFRETMCSIEVVSPGLAPVLALRFRESFPQPDDGQPLTR